MSSPLQFNGYQILRIEYQHTPSDKALPIDGTIPDPEPEIFTNQDNEQVFMVKLCSKILPESEQEHCVCPIRLEFEVVGFFELTEVLEEGEKDYHMAVSAPSILFGIIRTWVSQITAASGFTPLMLPSVQFGKPSSEDTIEE